MAYLSGPCLDLRWITYGMCMAMICDPQGAIFEVIKSETEQG